MIFDSISIRIMSINNEGLFIPLCQFVTLLRDTRNISGCIFSYLEKWHDERLVVRSPLTQVVSCRP